MCFLNCNQQLFYVVGASGQPLGLLCNRHGVAFKLVTLFYFCLISICGFISTNLSKNSCSLFGETNIERDFLYFISMHFHDKVGFLVAPIVSWFNRIIDISLIGTFHTKGPVLAYSISLLI